MGPLNPRPRRTALLALGLFALAGLLAAPGAADQTERINESFTNNESLDAMVLLNDTGETTFTLYKDSNTILTQKSRTINKNLATPVPLPTDTSRITVTSDRPGVDIIFGNLSQDSVSATTPIAVEVNVNTTTTVAVIGQDANPSVGVTSNDYDQIDDSGQLSVNESSDSVSILTIVPISNRNATIRYDVIQRFYNETITPGDSVEALRVSQTNDVPTERARVIISDADNGTELVNETIDSQTTVSYGLVGFDDTDNYTVTVTGIEVPSDSSSPTFETTRRKTNQPILALGGGKDVPQSARVLGIGLVILALAAILEHRKD